MVSTLGVLFYKKPIYLWEYFGIMTIDFNPI